MAGEDVVRPDDTDDVSGATLAAVSGDVPGEVDVLRTGFAVASDLVDRAREEAALVISDSQRRADLIIVEAERSAAAKRGEGDLYLNKARTVLEIAQQRAVSHPTVLDLVSLEAAGTDSSDDSRDDASHDARGPQPEQAVLPESDPLPGELDRLLREAVASAVESSVASSLESRPSGWG